MAKVRILLLTLFSLCVTRTKRISGRCGDCLREVSHQRRPPARNRCFVGHAACNDTVIVVFCGPSVYAYSWALTPRQMATPLRPLPRGASVPCGLMPPAPVRHPETAARTRWRSSSSLELGGWRSLVMVERYAQLAPTISRKMAIGSTRCLVMTIWLRQSNNRRRRFAPSP